MRGYLRRGHFDIASTTIWMLRILWRNVPFAACRKGMRCDTEPVLGRVHAAKAFVWRIKNPQGRTAAVTVGEYGLMPKY